MFKKFINEMKDAMGLFIPWETIESSIREALTFPSDLCFDARLRVGGTIVYVESSPDAAVMYLDVHGEKSTFYFSLDEDEGEIMLLHMNWNNAENSLSYVLNKIDEKFSAWPREVDGAYQGFKKEVAQVG